MAEVSKTENSVKYIMRCTFKARSLFNFSTLCILPLFVVRPINFLYFSQCFDLEILLVNQI
jgi:hypothetical protein